MPLTYEKLAAVRLQRVPDGYCQPENFGYDFRGWVSPYTKGAHKCGGIAIVLQDWASADFLAAAHDPRIAALGRDPDRITNSRLEQLLRNVLGLELSAVYATNVFPFVKPCGMSAPIPQRLANRTALEFTKPELDLARPAQVLALGRVAQRALRSVEVRCVDLPHPAARRLDLGDHERIWCQALSRPC
jgi:restriction system protein